MLFNSWIFLIFFIAVGVTYYALARTRYRIAWLLAASYVFYGWLNPLYVALVFFITVVNYFTAIRIETSQRKRTWLAGTVVVNISILAVFKYAAFIIVNLNAVLHLVDPSLSLPEPGRLLPIGLSFCTFMATGYIIDCYRGTAAAERNFIRLATFIAFFPYLLAGPIERAGNILPQWTRTPSLKPERIADGLSLFVVGLFKKIALADFLALYVNKVYAEPGDFGGLALLMATYAFAWQIYFDFSGYTDMARGCARMLGIDIMLNFNNPYLSASLGEFWQRWHISLSSWFRDYLYIPLGGNRRGRIGTYRNMILTMLVAGLWHGAAWNFVIWGGLHALGRTVTRELEDTAFYAGRVPKFVKQILIFHFVCVTWIFFRAETFGKAVTVLSGIFSNAWSDPLFPVAGILFILAAWAYQFIFESRFRAVLNLSAVRVGLMTAMIVYMIFFRTSGYEVFLYFRF
jgi:alginate O-acetyltransferase complex protein AlgI